MCEAVAPNFVKQILVDVENGVVMARIDNVSVMNTKY